MSRDNAIPLEHKVVATCLIAVSTFLGSICKELSYRRKEARGPYLTSDFKYACNRLTKPEKFLQRHQPKANYLKPNTTNILMRTYKILFNIFQMFFCRGAGSTGTAGASQCPCKHATAGLQV